MSVITCKEAAKILKLSTSQVKLYGRKGILTRVLQGNKYFYANGEVRRLAAFRKSALRNGLRWSRDASVSWLTSEGRQ